MILILFVLLIKTTLYCIEIHFTRVDHDALFRAYVFSRPEPVYCITTSDPVSFLDRPRRDVWFYRGTLCKALMQNKRSFTLPLR